MKPPSRAPAMPRRIVTMNPPGSLPGVTSFAMIPTISPKTIHDRIPMRSSFDRIDSLQGRHQVLEERWAFDAFMGEQPPFPVEAAAVSRELSVGSDDAMAGDDDGDGVGAVGRADGSHRCRFANALRQLAVGDGRSGWDSALGLPHL